MKMQGKRIDDMTLDNIALLIDKGLGIEQIGAICGIGHATVSRIKTAYKAAQDGDMETLMRATPYIGEWASRKCGIVIAAPATENPKPEKPDNTAAAFAALLESIKELTAAVNAIDKRLSAMQLTQQGFRGDVGEKIGKVVEAVNVNGDILTKEHDKMIELLGSVKSNTKRRADA